MSGGVDSSVAATHLAGKDYDLSAVYMRNWDSADETGTDNNCAWKKDWEDVQKICRILDLPVELIDLSKEYWLRVFAPALQQWENGMTPNPDIWCNREIKFGALLDRLRDQYPGTYLATGHYARIGWSFDDRPKLMRPKDRHKDQTYYLSSLSEASLQKALFPLSNLTKGEVRDLAKRYSLPTASREESMGLCFVGERRRFHDFLNQYLTPKPGKIVNEDGEVIGEHQGLWRYTIGQGAKLRGMPTRMYVSKKDHEKNEVMVVPSSNHPSLLFDSIISSDWHWIWHDHHISQLDSEKGFQATVKFRHMMSAVPCRIKREQGNIVIVFDEQQKAVSPGQVAVVWKGDWCLGCGTISQAL
ncbi:5-methylaminomethyl-2-thiouridylate-methyltransferase [Sistotremastrum niveocremeum HHB9708]|uniref:tRNA-5-taurinomethyluridine 2-sulfurtransferase n=1 Tax=Sistotremastrum niveocremeum HHB9708 TaxID=1314777 RepID=A0A164P685_9AGAM|nr:5-methylaminomethyl-2-thiouridylate-methyltransferase [Sistotremastrum niveocremeum HHB9708]